MCVCVCVLVAYLCPTLCNPIDCNWPSAPVHGSLQPRVLEWVAISFSKKKYRKKESEVARHVQLFATPWTVAYQCPPSMEFSRQEYCSGLPFPSPPLHYRGLKYKSRKSRNTWSNRQIWPWNTKWSRAKANRVLSREHTGYRKHHLPTTEEKTLYVDITRGSTPKSDWLYYLQPMMEQLSTVSKK